MSLASELKQPATHHIVDPDLFAQRVRADFPILRRQVHGKPLVYLDNAASTQKPACVIEALKHFYENDYANVHRGVHLLSQIASNEYEEVRNKVARFINARSTREVIFTRGTTEGINLVAQTFGRQNIGAGDEIIISTMEHHSNIVPWQMLCAEKKAHLRVIPMNDRGQLYHEEYERLLESPRVKLVALVHVSNALGTVTPVKHMIDVAHAKGVPVLIDAAQSVPHMKIDVQDLQCDFLAFSGHKIYGPSGIGVLYGREALLEAMPPWQGGGDMISSVSFEKTTYNELPFKFEAGTPNIADVVAFGAALDYVSAIGLDTIQAYEQDLLSYATHVMGEIKGLRIIGTAPCKASLISFVLDAVHPHDIGTILDQEGIAIRTGHHCAQPVMERLNVPATARASLAFYNTREEIDILVRGIHHVIEVLG
jgi:cysteine desulfurase/selenocysteine lyase